MVESADLPRDLRVVGGAVAPGFGHPGPGVLLGLYEGQSASAELHIKKQKNNHSPDRPETPERMALTETFIYLFKRDEQLLKNSVMMIRLNEIEL